MERNPLIVAIDTPEFSRANELISAVAPMCGMIKLGLAFFCANGPAAVNALHDLHKIPIMLDLKLHDIPMQVRNAVLNLCWLRGVKFITVHAAGGREMMNAALDSTRGIEDRPEILAVTALSTTVDQAAICTHALWAMNMPGIVCPANFIKTARKGVPNWTIVVPGVRPVGSPDPNDHAYWATPKQAIDAGAHYIVVGRPITLATNPRAAAADILDSL